jgi:hypothetical protein
MNSSNESRGGEVVVYEAPDGEVRVDVRLERETVWLTQQQMADVFGRERSVITKHVRNVFREGELESESVCAKFAHTAADGKTYHVDHYNLDVVISVGYRVKSLRGTQFRIWATRTLRDHLLRGYTLNERWMREKGLAEIEQAVSLLSRTLIAHALVTDEGRAVLEVVQRYTRTWHWLLQYDESRLPEAPLRPVALKAGFTLAEARAVITRLRDHLAARGETGSLFGQECGEALAGIPGSHRSNVRRPAALPQRTVAGRAPALLRHQGPPFRRRQQTHRHAALSRLPAAQRFTAPR